eukprot:CFRG5822T1
MLSTRREKIDWNTNIIIEGATSEPTVPLPMSYDDITIAYTLRQNLPWNTPFHIDDVYAEDSLRQNDWYEISLLAREERNINWLYRSLLMIRLKRKTGLYMWVQVETTIEHLIWMYNNADDPQLKTRVRILSEPYFNDVFFRFRNEVLDVNLQVGILNMWMRDAQTESMFNTEIRKIIIYMYRRGYFTEAIHEMNRHPHLVIFKEQPVFRKFLKWLCKNAGTVNESNQLTWNEFVKGIIKNSEPIMAAQTLNYMKLQGFSYNRKMVQELFDCTFAPANTFQEQKHAMFEEEYALQDENLMSSNNYEAYSTPSYTNPFAVAPYPVEGKYDQWQGHANKLLNGGMTLQVDEYANTGTSAGAGVGIGLGASAGVDIGVDINVSRSVRWHDVIMLYKLAGTLHLPLRRQWYHVYITYILDEHTGNGTHMDKMHEVTEVLNRMVSDGDRTRTQPDASTFKTIMTGLEALGACDIALGLVKGTDHKPLPNNPEGIVKWEEVYTVVLRMLSRFPYHREGAGIQMYERWLSARKRERKVMLSLMPGVDRSASMLFYALKADHVHMTVPNMAMVEEILLKGSHDPKTQKGVALWLADRCAELPVPSSKDDPTNLSALLEMLMKHNVFIDPDISVGLAGCAMTPDDIKDIIHAMNTTCKHAIKKNTNKEAKVNGNRRAVDANSEDKYTYTPSNTSKHTPEETQIKMGSEEWKSMNSYRVYVAALGVTRTDRSTARQAYWYGSDSKGRLSKSYALMLWEQMETLTYVKSKGKKGRTFVTDIAIASGLRALITAVLSKPVVQNAKSLHADTDPHTHQELQPEHGHIKEMGGGGRRKGVDPEEFGLDTLPQIVENVVKKRNVRLRPSDVNDSWDGALKILCMEVLSAYIGDVVIDKQRSGATNFSPPTARLINVALRLAVELNRVDVASWTVNAVFQSQGYFEENKFDVGLMGSYLEAIRTGLAGLPQRFGRSIYYDNIIDMYQRMGGSGSIITPHQWDRVHIEELLASISDFCVQPVDKALLIRIHQARELVLNVIKQTHGRNASAQEVVNTGVTDDIGRNVDGEAHVASMYESREDRTASLSKANIDREERRMSEVLELALSLKPGARSRDESDTGMLFIDELDSPYVPSPTPSSVPSFVDDFVVGLENMRVGGSAHGNEGKLLHGTEGEEHVHVPTSESEHVNDEHVNEDAVELDWAGDALKDKYDTDPLEWGTRDWLELNEPLRDYSVPGGDLYKDTNVGVGVDTSAALHVPLTEMDLVRALKRVREKSQPVPNSSTDTST